MLYEVITICDRVAVLSRGELRAEGTIGELLRKPEAVRYLIEGLSEEESNALRVSIEEQVSYNFV